MTKLEWCRANAPEALRELSDADLLDLMQDTLNNPAIEKPELEEDPTDAYTELVSLMDRMVLRLVREFGNKLAFKGGYMLSKLLGASARQTTDIDFSIQTSDLYQQLLCAFKEIAEEFVSEGFIASYKIKPEVRETMSGGMDMYAADGQKKLGVDVGWHDITFGTTTMHLDIADVNAFTVERMLADKLTAILSRKRFRRPKDIYDVYCLTNCFDFNAQSLNDYILQRTHGIGAEWGNFPFNEVVLREYEKAYDSLDIRAVTKTVEAKPDFDKVNKRFSTICMRLLNPTFDMHWSHEQGIFTRGC